MENLRSGNRFEDRELRKRIDARRFPTIRGVLTTMTETPTANTYRVTGDLEFRGVTQAIADDLTVELVDGDTDTIRLRGASTFDIRDFGMEPPRILVLRVEPTVNVDVDIVARRVDAGDGEEGRNGTYARAVVEDEAEGVAAPGPQHAHAVPHRRRRPAPRRSHRPVTGREHERVAATDDGRGRARTAHAAAARRRRTRAPV